MGRTTMTVQEGTEQGRAAKEKERLLKRANNEYAIRKAEGNLFIMRYIKNNGYWKDICRVFSQIEADSLLTKLNE